MKIIAAILMLMPISGCALPMAVSDSSVEHRTPNQTLAPNTEPRDRSSIKRKPENVILRSPSEQRPEGPDPAAALSAIDQVKDTIERRLYIIDDRTAKEVK
jgi:hypothetical protein